MLKLLICILSAFAIGVAVLQMRQQHMELEYQANKLHAQIEAQQAKLWQQQKQIAEVTAPSAIPQTVRQHDLKLVPRAPLPPEKANWTDPSASAGE